MNAVAMGIVERVVRDTYPAAVVTQIGRFKFRGSNFTGKVRVTAYGMQPIDYRVKSNAWSVTLLAVR